MDIRKLQRAIVDGLEDVKGQDIVVFNTEHLSPLFERVVVASGTSNRQTKALAASVRDAVRENGGQILSTEGSDNGEWIIVDCGAAVVHIMQPAIRQYYHLEEIWGGKQVKMKLASETRGLAKASEPEDDEPAPARKPAARKSADKLTAAEKAPARSAPGRTAASKTAPVKTVAAKKAPAKKAAAKRTGASPASAEKPPAKKVAAKKAATTKVLVINAPVRKPASGATAGKGAPRKRVSTKVVAKKPRA